jgi:high-affinity nickel-transport protein
MRAGVLDEEALEERLDQRGLMNRLLGRVMNAIDKPRQMYPVGLLFGLGFETATEVALLVMAASGAATGLPWYAVLCLPVLFAAGMSLLDTIDGSFKNVAYGWAFSHPVRKIYYNLTVTGLSVAVALIIGTVELRALLADQLTLTGGFALGRRAEPQHRRLRRGGAVRRSLGLRPAGVEARPYRAAVNHSESAGRSQG